MNTWELGIIGEDISEKDFEFRLWLANLIWIIIYGSRKFSATDDVSG